MHTHTQTYTHKTVKKTKQNPNPNPNFSKNKACLHRPSSLLPQVPLLPNHHLEASGRFPNLCTWFLPQPFKAKLATIFWKAFSGQYPISAPPPLTHGNCLFGSARCPVLSTCRCLGMSSKPEFPNWKWAGDVPRNRSFSPLGSL